MKCYSWVIGFLLLTSIATAQSDSLSTTIHSLKNVGSVSESEFLKEMNSSRTFFIDDRATDLSFATPKKKGFFNLPGSKFIVPTLCVVYGVSARFNDFPTRKFDKYIAERVQLNIHRHYPIDNYLVLAPAIVAYGLDFVPGVRSKHNFRDRTLILATSYLFMGATVQTLKATTNVDRPRRWNTYDAFPSGHTAGAFTGAHILYKEYKDQSVWIGVGGYTVAAATGVFRVLNNAHWVSDVAAGAGIGILSAEVGYMMLPVWHRMFGIEGKRSLVIVPTVSTQSFGVGMAYQF